MLPDIARRAGFTLHEKQVQPLYEQFPDLIDGIRLHWEADRIFHQSELFQFASQVWKSELEKFPMDSVERKFFLVHLLAEMWLDRVLLNLYPDEGQQLYRSMEQVDIQELRQFALKALDDKDGKLLQTVGLFAKRKFILAYAEAETFSDIAVGVFGHVTHQEVNPMVQKAIFSALPQLENQHENLIAMWDDFRLNFFQKLGSSKG